VRGQRAAPINVLDIGCGKGLSLRDLLAALAQQQVSVRRVVGMDLLQSPGHVFNELPPGFEFMEINVDGRPLPLPDGSFDLVVCNHVLEHVFETENLLREIRRVLRLTGRAVLSVPNIAAWINRLLFLMAGTPLGIEVGTESVTYGFWPRLGQARLARFTPAGHIRSFTPRALADLCRACGFSVEGWWNQSEWPWFPLTRLGGPQHGDSAVPARRPAIQPTRSSACGHAGSLGAPRRKPGMAGYAASDGMEHALRAGSAEIPMNRKTASRF